ncbi:glycosyltransferase family 2 protein [Chachezhania antarctica]|uniref:glycosyltransferase family 2 protein n=1 Tax=Chachezhania antarctica TaxID=2340860 RepID=UPI000EAB9C5D|nr:glycosyltransferase family 2 protein [Chachezhania antarctica]
MFLIVSTMKNEAPYILEWVAFHKAIGFDAFLIYTNDCTDGTDLMLDRLEELGHVIHRRNEVLRRGPHKSALKYAMTEEIYAQADWVYVTDADEFLNVKVADGRVQDLVDAYPNADAIPVTWKHFSNDGVADLPKDFMIRQFTDAESATADGGAEEKGRFVKSLFRPDARIEKLGLHGPNYLEDAQDSIVFGSAEPGSAMRPQSAFGYDVAQVNHYAVRSVDAFLLKRDRGRANHVGETLGAAYWNRWNRGGERDTSIAPLIPAMEAVHADLIADEKLAFFDRAGKAIAQARLTELLEDPEIAALRRELTGSVPQPPKAPAAAVPVEAPAQKPAKNNFETPDQANDALQAKAPNRHKKRQEMLGLMPPGGRCAEIGVWNGGFSKEILNITAPTELVLIDPWDLLAQRDSSEWNHKAHQDAQVMEGMYDNVVDQYGDRADVTIQKGFSADVLSGYPDDYFDWVYIDGNHQYEFVLSDVEMSFHKVRAGGIIAGDDFFWKKDGRMHVREAVMDAIQERGLDRGRCFSRIGQQFMIKVEK